MAYLPQSEIERQKQLAQQQGQGFQQLASGPSGVISGASTAGTTSPQKGGGPSKSGSFVNLQNYINANRDQGSQLAQNVGNNVSEQAEKAKTALSNAQSSFNQGVQNSGVSRNQGLIQEAVAKPAEFVSDQNKVQELSKIRTAQYAGPQSLLDVDAGVQARQQLEDSEKKVQALDSESGRMAAVSEQFARPSYSKGQQRLDQLLLQNTPEARTNFADLRARYSGLSSMFGSAEEQAKQQADARRQETESARQEFQQAFGQLDDPTTAVNEAAGALGGFQTELRAKTDDYRNKQQELYNRILKQTGAGGEVSMNPGGAAEFDADVLEALGLKDGDKLYDLNLSSLAPTFNPDAINEQNVATADDYARFAALAQLAGLEAPGYLANQRAAASAPAVQLDKEQLKAQLANANTRYQNLMRDDYDAAITNAQRVMYDPNMADWGFAPGEMSSAEGVLANYDNIISRMNPRGLELLRSGGGYLGQAFPQLERFVQTYRSLNPNRVATARKK